MGVNNVEDRFFSPGDDAALPCEYSGSGQTFLRINNDSYAPISNYRDTLGYMVSAAGGVLTVENLGMQDDGKFIQCGNLSCFKASYIIHIATGRNELFSCMVIVSLTGIAKQTSAHA